jgi:hypothetical protein
MTDSVPELSEMNRRQIAQGIAMTENGPERHLLDFDHAITHGVHPDDYWKALQNLTGAVAGFGLFTVMTVDLANLSLLRACWIGLALAVFPWVPP